MRKLFAVLFTITLLIAAPALAQQVITPAPNIPALSTLDAAQVRKVEVLLSGYHEIPQLAQLTAASPRAEDIVAGLVRAADTSPFIRPRAISALVAYWPNARSLQLTRALIAQPTTGEITRHQLLMALPAFGQQAIPDLVPFLADKDVQLRLTAVEALGRLSQHDAAIAALHKALDAERDPIVRERITRAARAIR
jgi:HEAT repeat protein